MSISDTPLSKLAQKVIKNTLIINSNDLRFKESTYKSQFSLLSKHQSSTSGQGFDMSLISQISNINASHINIFSIHELDLSNMSFNITKETSYNLQELIKISCAGSVITLPPKKLSFTDLMITSPITLKGLPGAIIEVTNGSITIDFSVSSPYTQAAIICELALQFSLNFDVKRSRKNSAAFIVMDSENSCLEVRDCDLRSNNHGAQAMFDDSFAEIEDVCFWVSGVGKKGLSRQCEQYNSSLIVSSCNVSGFFECCRAGAYSNVVIDKSYITGCYGNGLSFVNPRRLLVKNSVINKTSKNAVDINIIPENKPKVSSNALIKDSQKILIENNDIQYTGGYGVNVWSENFSKFGAKLKIINNRINNCKKEGIAIRHISIINLTVESNASCENEGTGLWLQKVSAVSIRVFNNKSSDNYSGYGIYIYDTGGVMKNNEFCRNSLGGVMVVGSSKGIDADLLLKSCLIQKNGENGISIMDYSKGIIGICKCKILENSNDGINLLQSRDTHIKNSKFIENALVKIKACEVHKNQGFGLSILKFKCLIGKLKSSNNKQGNIMIGEDTQPLVRFLAGHKTDVSLQIGENYVAKPKKSICGRHKCNII